MEILHGPNSASAMRGRGRSRNFHVCKGVTSRFLMPGVVEGPCMVLLQSSQAVGHGEMKKTVTLVTFWNGFYHFKAGIQLRRYFKTCCGLLTVLVKKAMCIHAFIHPCTPTCLPTYVHACIPYHTISKHSMITYRSVTLRYKKVFPPTTHCWRKRPCITRTSCPLDWMMRRCCLLTQVVWCTNSSGGSNPPWSDLIAVSRHASTYW